MLGMVTATLTVLATWAVVWGVFVGLGLLLRRAFGLRALSPGDLFFCFWVGYAVTIAALQMWHLALPVDGRAVALLVMVAVAGLVVWRRQLVVCIRSLDKRHVVPAIAMCAVALFLSNRAIGSVRVYDAGLYHLSAVRWAAEYRIVPGLVNLHERLAFNSSHFLYAALLETGPLLGRSFHVTNSVLVFVLSCQVIGALWRTLTADKALRSTDLFMALAAAPVAGVALSSAAVSTAPYVTVFAAGLLACERLLALSAPDELEEEERPWSLFFIAAVAAAAFTVKLSFAVHAMLATAVAVVLFSRGRGHWWHRFGQGSALAAACWAILVVPWATRGIVLSGYPAYPCAVGGVDVAWRAPHSSAANMCRVTKRWARSAGSDSEESLRTWRWVIPWFRNNIKGTWQGWFYVLGPCAVFTLVVAFNGVSLLQDRNWHPPRYLDWLLLVPWLGGAAVWFRMAPAVRFAGSTFWVLALVTVALTLRRFLVSQPGFAVRVFASWLLVAAGLAVCVVGARYVLHNGLFVRGGPDDGFHPAPTASVVARQTTSGLTVYVPAEGDQCWDAPLPCAPHFNARVRLRRPGDLGSGFVRESGPSGGP